MSMNGSRPGRGARVGLAAALMLSSVVTGSAASAADRVPAPTVSVTRITGEGPFGPECEGVPLPPPPNDVRYVGSEVEPHVAADPSRPGRLAAAWMQDRWVSGGARGLQLATSVDGGRTWRPTAAPPFSRCAGGNAENGGDYERAVDPWLAYAPNGDLYFSALVYDFVRGPQSLATNAIVVARSKDGGRTWGPTTTVARNTDPRFFNDKEVVATDPADSRYAYLMWNREDTPDPNVDSSTSPTFFARTTDGGRTWEAPRMVYDPGPDASTIGHQVVSLSDGTLLAVFSRRVVGANGEQEDSVQVMRSTDHGGTWSEPMTVARQ